MGRLYMITGDYIDNSKGMDAIVNSQNKYMIYGSGICGSIYRAAGEELEEYCKKTYDKCIEVGEVRITPGFNLDKDVIHILAPKSYEEKNPIEKLIETYNILLNNLKNNKYKKVLINSLGTGVHGYKHNEVAFPVIELLINFCKSNDVDIYLNNIYPLYKDEYLISYLKINKLNLKKDLQSLDDILVKEYLINNCLQEVDIIDKYNNFVEGKNINDMCLSEKLIYLQYMLDIEKNHNVIETIISEL